MVNMVFKKALEVAAGVLHGYQYGSYDYLEIADETSGRSLKVTKEILAKAIAG